MQEIQLSNEQNQELLSMQRKFTQADIDTFNQAYAELDKKGFVLSGENLMIIVRAYDKTPQATITVPGILDYTKKYRDAFEWLSAAEVEYKKLSAELGPDQTQMIIAQLGKHGLVNTGEDLFINFNTVIQHFQSQGWSVNTHSFANALGNLRNSRHNASLVWKPTRDQLDRQKRWDKAKEVAPLTVQQLFEAAKAKAASVAHIVNPDGTRMSDQVMRQFHEAHPDFSETATPVEKAPLVEDQYEAYYKKQVGDYVNSIASNLIRQEAEAEAKRFYDSQKSYRAAYNSLRIWHERRTSGAQR